DRLLDHDRRALVRREPAGLDVLGPVARDLVPGRELAQKRDLLAAPRRLNVWTARVEPARGRRGRGGRGGARAPDRPAPRLGRPRAGWTGAASRPRDPESAPPRAARSCTGAAGSRRAPPPARPRRSSRGT